VLIEDAGPSRPIKSAVAAARNLPGRAKSARTSNHDSRRHRGGESGPRFGPGGGEMPANARAIVARYRQVWREVQASAAFPKMGIVRFIVVAESDSKALSSARRSYLRWRSFNYLSEKNGTLPESPLNVESFDELISQGQGIAGSPQTVRAALAAQIEESGVNYVVGQFCFGDLSLDEMLRSVELFSAHVMPPLRATIMNLTA
jgi:alkanesulfonate monooxygenase SsuD/methylene tetrahydromethanopterin reductase-like flavin-dependent oxidoreductase (luciferase family)